MATKRSSWPAFDDAETVEWQLFQDGDPAGHIDLPGTATQQDFFAESGSSYRVEVRGVTAAVEASIDDGGSESGGGGGE